jgi:superfamily II DNA or RNA helicase
VFDCVNYKLILCLTATLERLDGKHEIIKEKCPVVDEISQLETVVNGWVSPYREYEVLIDVDDIDDYKDMNKEFQRHFEFFNFDFNLAISCCGKDGWKNKLRYRDELYKGSDENKKKEILQAISYHAAGLMRTMQQRKAFINNHPKKIELARKIIEAREGKKIITFSNSVKMAESIGIGAVYTGRDSKKKGRMTLEEFSNSDNINVLNSCNKLDEGLNVPGISVGIIIGTNSSEIKARQRRGRTIRAQDGKLAEIFYIIINDTVECQWFKKSHSRDSNYIIVDEEGLDKVLEGKTPNKAKNKPAEFMFQF